MTTSEQKTIDQLYKVVQELRQENSIFRDELTQRVDTVQKVTDHKHMPVFLEQDILRTAQQSIGQAIADAFKAGYNNPMTKLIASVVDENAVELRAIISDSFTQVIRTEDFKAAIVGAFSHKVARSIISNNDGLYDKVSNELKQDTIFKSKMALAVANVVNECLVNKSNP